MFQNLNRKIVIYFYSHYQQKLTYNNKTTQGIRKVNKTHINETHKNTEIVLETLRNEVCICRRVTYIPALLVPTVL